MRRFFKYISISLSRKLSLWIVLFAAIIFNVALGFMFSQSLGAVKKEAISRATEELENTVLRVNNILQRVEVTADNMEWLINRHLNTPDSMFIYSRRILENNEELNGCSIAFEPYYYREKGKYFSAYSLNKDGEILTTQEGNVRYEYFYMDWYLTPKLLDRPVWTEPFFDFNPENIYSEEMIASHSRPIKDSNGEFIGTFSTDISLRWLSETISAVKPYPNSYSIMVGEGGTFFVHPDSTKLFYQTIFTETLEHPNKAVSDLGHAMLSGEEGMRQLHYNGEDCYVFYKPLGTTGWSVAIVCLESDIFAGYKHLLHIVFIIVIFGLLLMLFVFSRIVSRELKPLRDLADQTDTISKGNFEQKLPLDKRTDEIGRLSQSFVDMQQSLIKYVDELKDTTATKASMESEIKVASTIQASMLPRIFPPFPERKDIDLYASMIPAKEVGGDLFDFFLRDEKLFFIIGDVSGKGVPAAMLMAVTHSLFRSASAHDSDPSNIIHNINSTICLDNDAMMFVTVFLGVLDLPSGRLRYCNAGHDCPFLLADEPVKLDCQPNLPLGIMADMKYVTQEHQMAPGSTLFLYTDGLTEAMNAQYLQFGEERIVELLHSCCLQKLSPRQILDSVWEGVHGFVKEADQSDDLTMLALRYTPGKFATQLVERITLNCDLNRIPELNDFIESIGERLQLDPPTIMQVQLAVEEAVVNVMNYAYPEGRNGFVTIKVMSDGHELRIVIIDSGRAFDPTRKEKADTTLSVEDRPIGGLGIFMIREMMDTINYERVDGRNLLMMIKIIKPDNHE